MQRRRIRGALGIFGGRMKKLFVFIISDAPEVSESLALCMTYAGHRAVTFYSIPQMLDAPELPDVCAVICDMMRPGPHERQLATSLLARSPATPLYVVANNSGTHKNMVNAPANVAAIMEGPCDPRKLEALIGDVCLCDSELAHAE